jgi:hypothetical protein
MGTIMTVIEYILDPQDQPRSFNPKTIPSYVTDGGHWFNPDGSEKMIGVGKEGSIPDSVTTFTLEELQARQLAIHAKYPMGKFRPNEEEVLTDEEVNAVVKVWWDARL